MRRLKRFSYNSAERRHSMVGPAKLWQMKREFQIKFLKQVRLQPQHYFLDIGCGTLRGGIPIIAYLEIGHYFGIESRKTALDEARKELKEAGLTHKGPKLIAAEDISNVKLENRFDYILAFSVLIHMKDEILYDTLRFVRSHLKNTGFFYANVHIGNNPDGFWQGFPVVWRSLDFYQEACLHSGLRLHDIGPLKTFGHTSEVESQDNQRMLKVRII